MQMESISGWTKGWSIRARFIELCIALGDNLTIILAIVILAICPYVYHISTQFIYIYLFIILAHYYFLFSLHFKNKNSIQCRWKNVLIITNITYFNVHTIQANFLAIFFLQSQKRCRYKTPRAVQIRWPVKSLFSKVSNTIGIRIRSWEEVHYSNELANLLPDPCAPLFLNFVLRVKERRVCWTNPHVCNDSG